MTAVLAFFAGPIGRWLVVAALVASALFAGGVYERGIGYREGLDTAAKEIQAQAKANAKAVAELDQKYRKQEQTQAAELAAQGIEYEKNLKIAQGIRDRDVAAARSGALKLSIAAHCGNANSSNTSEATSSPSVGHGEARTELPSETAATLLAIGGEADEVVLQLNACQTVIQSYLKGPQ